MANFKLKKYIGAMALGAVILTVPGCSDTWDEHYSADNSSTNGSTATENLWEQIKKDPNLSRFATIVEKCYYWKDETHAVKTYTFADVLKSGQVNTVWAPENRCFTDEEYEKWLEMCETEGYNVQQQLIGNHIARWRHIIPSENGDTMLLTDLDTLKMINGKNLIFDKHAGTMQGLIIGKKNIPATNGILHTLTNGTTPFEFSLYEYLKFGNAPELFSAYVLSKDTTYFYRSASIEGMPDENGNPTYVDSVYRTDNRLNQNKNYLPRNNADEWMTYDEGYGAQLNEEDSMFIMVIPSDVCWENTKQKLAPYYKYSPVYEDKDKGNQGTTFVMDWYDPDSLSNTCIEMDMISPLVFNVNKQPKIGGTYGTPWTLDTFVASKGVEAEYFLNTYGDTLRNTPTWEKSTLFDGTMHKYSNGYGFEVDSWNYPVEFYKPDVEVEIGGGVFYYTSNSTYYKVGNGTGTQSFSNNVFKDIADKYGKVSKDNFYLLMNPGSSSGAKVEIRLRGNLNTAYVPNAEVMSGKYDVQLVVVPYWYKAIRDAGVIDSVYYDSLYVDSVASKNKNKIIAQIRYNNGTKKDKLSTKRTITFDGTKVDTITVEEDFEFPYSYKNLRFSYPTLLLESKPTTSDAKKGYIYQLCIDRVILKNKDTNDEIIVDPA